MEYIEPAIRPIIDSEIIELNLKTNYLFISNLKMKY